MNKARDLKDWLLLFMAVGYIYMCIFDKDCGGVLIAHAINVLSLILIVLGYLYLSSALDAIMGTLLSSLLLFVTAVYLFYKIWCFTDRIAKRIRENRNKELG